MAVITYIYLGIFFICCKGTFSLPASDKQCDDKLVLSFPFFRHGDRTPFSFYPTDPYKDRKYWPEAQGELTQQGMTCQFELGKWLRKHYHNFLPEVYHSDDIYVHSTEVNRTIMSAQSNLAGLYFSEGDSILKNWNPDIRWRPIPVHQEVDDDFPMLFPKAFCPRYSRLFDRSKDYVALTEAIESSHMFQIINKNAGLEGTSPWDAVFIYDTLRIESLFGYDLPAWTKQVYPEPLKSLSDKFVSLGAKTPELARLRFGPTIKFMVETMKKKIEGKLYPDNKVIMFSTHDIILSTLMESLNVFNDISPPYCSLVLIQLKKSCDKYFVTMDYKNTTTTVYPLTIPGCDDYRCPLDQFKKVVAPLSPDDWGRECHDFSGL